MAVAITLAVHSACWPIQDQCDRSPCWSTGPVTMLKRSQRSARRLTLAWLHTRTAPYGKLTKTTATPSTIDSEWTEAISAHARPVMVADCRSRQPERVPAGTLHGHPLTQRSVQDGANGAQSADMMTAQEAAGTGRTRWGGEIKSLGDHGGTARGRAANGHKRRDVTGMVERVVLKNTGLGGVLVRRSSRRSRRGCGPGA